jgi:hypothetical protein
LPAEEAGATASTSTDCWRQWALQVRRRVRPATSAQRSGLRMRGGRSTVAGRGKRRRTATLLGGHACLWHFAPDSGPQAHRADNPSERRGRGRRFSQGIFLTHFTRSGGWLLLESAALRLLAKRRHRLPNGGWPLQMPLLAASAHTPATSFPRGQERQELPKPLPTPSQVAGPLAWSCLVREPGVWPQ